MKKIIDCITYFDEDMLLDFRLNILNDYVDYFVIVEAKEDHQGKKKNLNFNIENFKKYKDKIIYLIQEKIIVDKNIILPKNWSKDHLRDQSQRNYISNALKQFDDNDWIIISDFGLFGGTDRRRRTFCPILGQNPKDPKSQISNYL